MSSREVDIAIIGAGTAGLTAYNAASRHTDSLVLIDSGPLGTTCARVGCMPSKLLIAAASAAHGARHSSLFGIQVGELEIDGAAVMDRLHRERDRFVDSVLDSLGRIPDNRKLAGRARFLATNRLGLDDGTEIEAGRIVIATGARPNVPGFLREAGERLLTNENLFELESLPGSVAVFGPGVLGLELGQALSRLGAKVRMFGTNGSLASIGDAEIRQYACRCFNEEFYLDLSADVKQVERVANGVAITYRHRQKGEITEEFDYVLAATGRRPNIDELDLEKSGLELDEEGLPEVDPRTLQCGESPIFLVGDANTKVPFLHVAAEEGRIAGRNAARYPHLEKNDRLVDFSVVFSDPQVASVGLRMPELGEQCPDRYAEGKASFEDQGRSRVMGRNRGLVKVYGERGSGRFLGAEIFGPAAEHTGHLLAWAAECGLTVSQMLAMPYYHPVVEEGLRTALKDLSYRLEEGPRQEDRCLECGPGG
jgi:dihydrolipoamide dehydrogenase